MDKHGGGKSSKKGRGCFGNWSTISRSTKAIGRLGAEVSVFSVHSLLSSKITRGGKVAGPARRRTERERTD